MHLPASTCGVTHCSHEICPQIFCAEWRRWLSCRRARRYGSATNQRRYFSSTYIYLRSSVVSSAFICRRMSSLRVLSNLVSWQYLRQHSILTALILDWCFLHWFRYSVRVLYIRVFFVMWVFPKIGCSCFRHVLACLSLAFMSRSVVASLDIMEPKYLNTLQLFALMTRQIVDD